MRMEMLFKKGGVVEFWNHTNKECVATGKVGAEKGDDGFDPMINLVIAKMVIDGLYDPSNPITEGIVILEDKQ